jgi:hypothetical protein
MTASSRADKEAEYWPLPLPLSWAAPEDPGVLRKTLTLLMRKTTRTPDPAYRFWFKRAGIFYTQKRRVSQDTSETTTEKCE